MIFDEETIRNFTRSLNNRHDPIISTPLVPLSYREIEDYYTSNMDELRKLEGEELYRVAEYYLKFFVGISDTLIPYVFKMNGLKVKDFSFDKLDEQTLRIVLLFVMNFYNPHKISSMRSKITIAKNLAIHPMLEWVNNGDYFNFRSNQLYEALYIKDSDTIQLDGISSMSIDKLLQEFLYLLHGYLKILQMYIVVNFETTMNNCAREPKYLCFLDEFEKFSGNFLKMSYLSIIRVFEAHNWAFPNPLVQDYNSRNYNHYVMILSNIVLVPEMISINVEYLCNDSVSSTIINSNVSIFKNDPLIRDYIDYCFNNHDWEHDYSDDLADLLISHKYDDHVVIYSFENIAFCYDHLLFNVISYHLLEEYNSQKISLDRIADTLKMLYEVLTSLKEYMYDMDNKTVNLAINSEDENIISYIFNTKYMMNADAWDNAVLNEHNPYLDKVFITNNKYGSYIEGILITTYLSLSLFSSSNFKEGMPLSWIKELISNNPEDYFVQFPQLSPKVEHYLEKKKDSKSSFHFDNQF